MTNFSRMLALNWPFRYIYLIVDLHISTDETILIQCVHFLNKISKDIK